MAEPTPQIPVKVAQTGTARVFVGMELIISLVLTFFGWVAIGSVCWWTQTPVWAAIIIAMVFAVNVLLLQIVLMLYRTITYLLNFMTMADLLDATRIAITSLFAPGRRQP